MNKKIVQNDQNKEKNSKFKMSSNNLKPLVKTEIMGVGITNASKSIILEYLNNFINKSAKKMYIVTPNPEMIVFAAKNEEFKKALNHAQIALCDGVGLYLAAKFFGKNLKERVTGISLMESICEMVNEKPITVGFLGGRLGVAEDASECLKKRYPNLKVKFTGSEWRDFEASEKKSLDILFIAFGVPKQELFMMNNLGKLPVRVMVGVGGAFDQIVNPTLRPPKIIDAIGFGWLYRLIRQPWRWKRQLALIEFIKLMIKFKFES